MATSAPVIPFHHPDRPESEFRPLKAWHHFRNLMADKEDTEQVFHIIAALRGRKFRAVAEKFWHSDKGQNLLASDQRLIDILDDHDTLKQLPLPAFADRVCHATINVDCLDPDCVLPGLVLKEPQDVGPVEYILNNSFGMLGINSVVIIKRL